MNRSKFQSGFSLIEALVVLAISGMALSIIFSIGVKAGDTGFGLGRRAISAADSDLSYSDVRTLIRSFELRPAASFKRTIDSPLVGSPARLVGDVVMERGTKCAPQGWAGSMILEIIPQGENGTALICEVAGRRMTLMDLPSSSATLSYSTDGENWSPGISTEPPLDQDPSDLRAIRIWIRLNLAPRPDIVEMASSGDPQSWARDDGV